MKKIFGRLTLIVVLAFVLLGVGTPANTTVAAPTTPTKVWFPLVFDVSIRHYVYAYGMFPNSTCALDYGVDPWRGDCFKCDLTVYCRFSCSDNVFYLETWDGSDCAGCSTIP